MKSVLISTLLVAVNCFPQYDYPQSSVGFPAGQQSSGGFTETKNNIGNNGKPSNGRPGPKYLPSNGQSLEPEQPTIIQKHVYLHVPPPELEEAPPTQRPLNKGRKEKHYKIIFVKAPTPPQSSTPVIPPYPGREEKTIVYVLVKKPEDAQDIVIPTPAPTEPVKPEVYFIRYKSMKKKDNEMTEEGYPDRMPTNGGQNGAYLPPRRS